MERWGGVLSSLMRADNLPPFLLRLLRGPIM